MGVELSKHAQTRLQQRAIPELIVDCLVRFGSRQPAGDGVWKCFFDKRSRRKLAGYAGPLANQLDAYSDVYVVVSADEKVVTAAHRLERIRRA